MNTLEQPPLGSWIFHACTFALALLFSGGARAGDASPDLILYNAKIFTAADSSPYVEAVAVRGERIIATGSSQQISKLASKRTVLRDLHGRVVIPGINDAHYHLFLQPPGVQLVLSGQEPDWQELQSALTKAVASTPASQPIYAEVGATIFQDSGVDRRALDQLAPDHPVILRGWTGHFYILNTRALRMLGISASERDLVGGQYLRSPPTGELNGRVLEYAAFQLHRRISELVSNQEALRQTREFIQTAVRFGITTVQQMSMPVSTERLVKLFRDAPTPIRMRIMWFSLTDAQGRVTRTDQTLIQSPAPRVTVSGTKWVLDGTPIERNCAMRQPYADRPDTSGTMDVGKEDMIAMLRESVASGQPLIAHIVCDRTTETFLDAMDATGGPSQWANRRVRIEHGDSLAPDLLARARPLGVVVVQNPTHLSLRDLLIARWGPQRAQHEFQPLRSILDAGIPLALGSDGPINPYLNIMFAVTDPVRPEEAINREQAVTAYTRTSAFAEFTEQNKGTIEPGKLADLAVLSQDIFEVPAAELPKTESLLTIVGGKMVYDHLAR